MLDAFGADHVGELAADQQDRDLQVHGRLFEILGAQLGVVPGLGHERRIPVPVPAAVAQPQVLFQPFGAAWLLAVAEIGGDGVGRLLQRAESVDAADHEIADAGAAVLLESRHHVDQDQSGHLVGPALSATRMPVNPPMLAPIITTGPADRVQHAHDVGGQRFDGVVRVRRAVAVPVTPAVQRDDVKARRRPGSGRCSSRRTGFGRRRATSGSWAGRSRVRRGSTRRRSG